MEDRNEMLAKLESIRHNVSDGYYDGMVDAINEYYDLAEEKHIPRDFKYGADPMEYYKYIKGENPVGIVPSKKYIDLNNTKTLAVDRSTIYKMFNRQVVDAFKKGKITELPYEWNLGNYNKNTSNFNESVQTQLDYMINNMSPDDLYEAFRPDKTKEFYNEEMNHKDPLANIKFRARSSMGIPDNTSVKVSETFGRINSEMTKFTPMNKVNYLDYNNNPINVKDYTPMTGDESKEFNKGLELAGLQRSRGVKTNDYLASEFNKDMKGKDFNKFKNGYFSGLANNGENVKVNAETGEPVVFGNININPNSSVDMAGNTIDYVDLPAGVKNYVDRFKFMKNLTGSDELSNSFTGGVMAQL